MLEKLFSIMTKSAARKGTKSKNLLDLGIPGVEDTTTDRDSIKPYRYPLLDPIPGDHDSIKHPWKTSPDCSEGYVPSRRLEFPRPSISAEGWNVSWCGLGSLVGVGPKWSFHCHQCGYNWRERIPFDVDEPTFMCQRCGNKSKLHGMKWD